MSGRSELPSGLVTFMFTDIEGSTRLARMLGEGYGSVLGAHREVVRAALSDFGGVELLTEGDSFFVAFGDAAAAVAACVTAQRGLATYDWPHPDVAPKVRMGLHTGWAVPNGGEYASAEVHRAARVAAAAHGGQVLCSEATAAAATTRSLALTSAPSLVRVDPPPAAGRFDPMPPVPAVGRFDLTPPVPAAGRFDSMMAVPATRTASTLAAPGVDRLDPMAGVELVDLGRYELRGFDDAERLFQLVAPGLDRDFPRPRTPGAPRHNLPAQVTTFLGRRAELADLTAQIGRRRLVTVAGPGGAGKTRLALAAAESLLPLYPDGVWMVDAAGLATEPAERGLIEAIAGVLGLRSEPGRPLLDTVVGHCARKRFLLLLDTCDAAPAVTSAVVVRLLAACPDLDVLATSREPLGVHGEVVWRIPPLVPSDAVDLLSDRATAARGGRPATSVEMADLARVAHRLEGSPLALELAAARLRLLSGGQLAGRLDDPLGALDGGRLTTGRHDSLTGSLDWSYRRLGRSAARLLRRLAVFSGPVDLATVEWCGADALGALSELADKSLVDVVPGPRFKLSGQVRAYALRRLAEAGDERVARDRHVAWALHTLDEAMVHSDGQSRAVSLTALAPYVEEWQAALRWSVRSGSARAGLRLAGALHPWWRENGAGRPERDLMAGLITRLDATASPVEVASACLIHAGIVDDRAEQVALLSRAEQLARAASEPALQVRALAGVPGVRSERDCRELITRAEQAGVPGAALPAVVALCESLWRRDALDEAAELLGGARQAEAGLPEERGRRTVDWLLGMVALRRGDLVAAHDHLVVALRSRLRHGFRGAAADATAAIAVRCVMGRDPATAAVLFGGAEMVRGVRRTGVFGPFWSAQQAATRQALGDATFDAAYARGAELGFDRIVAMALAVPHPDLEQGSVRFAQTR